MARVNYPQQLENLENLILIRKIPADLHRTNTRRSAKVRHPGFISDSHDLKISVRVLECTLFHVETNQLVSVLMVSIIMRKLSFFISFLVINAFANNASYFPADIEKARASILEVPYSFSSEPIDISLFARRPMSGLDAANQPYTIPMGSNILIQTTADQIYESFKRNMETESMFSRIGTRETMTMENPEAVRIRATLMELIQLKMQENAIDRMGGGTSKAQREMVEVRVKKEGEAEKKIKVAPEDLQKAIKDESVVVEEDEIISPRTASDYDGSDTWEVKKKTESGLCLFCDKKLDNLSSKLELDATNAYILATYAPYSKDKQTVQMIEYAKKNKRDPKEYKKSKFKWCYRYVKNALLNAKLTSKRLEGVLPRNAGDKLKAEGFTNIMDDPHLIGKITDPSQAPKGAILVYEPNPITRVVRSSDKDSKRDIVAPDAGHIEIKTEDVGKGGFVSDYYSERSRTGKGLVSDDRKLIGIYVKK